MKWPWSPKPPVNRGTLSFLANGEVVIGFPRDASEEAQHYVLRDLKAWLASPAKGKVLIFPFPIDVVDNRRTR